MNIPQSTRSSLQQRLARRARERWPELSEIRLRFRGRFAYVDGVTTDVVRLCRLRYGGSAGSWGLAMYRASHDDYEDSVLPNGLRAGPPEDSLDCACGLYLNDPTGWADLRKPEGPGQ